MTAAVMTAKMIHIMMNYEIFLWPPLVQFILSHCFWSHCRMAAFGRRKSLGGAKTHLLHSR